MGHFSAARPRHNREEVVKPALHGIATQICAPEAGVAKIARSRHEGAYT